MVATQRELFDATVPLHWRDYCSHALIPLNDCRRDNYYLPWKCGHERHAYEQCQFKESADDTSDSSAQQPHLAMSSSHCPCVL
jgi:NADH dehydrogenase (ubiquinone) 1 beta subcomplex subunit 7